MMPREQVGVLILRVWLEQGSTTLFRATIRMTPDVGAAPPVSVSVATPDKVVDVVRGFLEQVAGGSVRE
jgi:hypothetical protein